MSLASTLLIWIQTSWQPRGQYFYPYTVFVCRCCTCDTPVTLFTYFNNNFTSHLICNNIHAFSLDIVGFYCFSYFRNSIPFYWRRQRFNCIFCDCLSVSNYTDVICDSYDEYTYVRIYVYIWFWLKSLKNSPVTTKVLSLIFPKTNSRKSGFLGRRFANWIQMPFLYITRSLACQTEGRFPSLRCYNAFFFF